MNKLKYLFPFMESEELKELAIKIINEEVKGVKLRMLFPFLRNKDLNDIVDLLIEKNDGRNLSYAIPFVSHERLQAIYKAVREGKITNIKESHLYPFLDKDQLKEIFNDLVKEAMENPEEDEDDDRDDEDYEIEEEEEVEEKDDEH